MCDRTPSNECHKYRCMCMSGRNNDMEDGKCNATCKYKCDPFWAVGNNFVNQLVRILHGGVIIMMKRPAYITVWIANRKQDSIAAKVQNLYWQDFRLHTENIWLKCDLHEENKLCIKREGDRKVSQLTDEQESIIRIFHHNAATEHFECRGNGVTMSAYEGDQQSNNQRTEPTTKPPKRERHSKFRRRANSSPFLTDCKRVDRHGKSTAPIDSDDEPCGDSRKESAQKTSRKERYPFFRQRSYSSESSFLTGRVDRKTGVLHDGEDESGGNSGNAHDFGKTTRGLFKFLTTIIGGCVRKEKPKLTPVDNSKTLQEEEEEDGVDKEKSERPLSTLSCSSSPSQGESGLPKLIKNPDIPSSVVSKNYISGIFDETGGHLVLSDMAVSLFIPPGALPRGKTQEIFLYVSWEDRHQPRCSNRESQLGPAIICGPNGLTFQEDVCLTFRHWMTDSREEVKISPVFSATDLDQPCDYQPLVDPSARPECQRAMCLFNDKDNTCTILVDHFTGFSLKGQSPEPRGESRETFEANPETQWMCVVPYISMQTDIQVRLYVRKHSTGAEQAVEKTERSLRTPGEKCSPLKMFPMLLNGLDIVASVDNVEVGWHCYPKHHNAMALRYNCLSEIGEEVCEFTFRKEDPTSCTAESTPHPGTFRCCISLVQSQNEHNKVEFSVSQDLQKSLVYCNPGMVRKPSLSVAVRHQISAYLDPEHPLGNDWKKFAEWLGYSAIIDGLEYEWEKKGKSPTQKLLSLWESMNLSGKVGNLCKMREFFKSIDRDDVLRELANRDVSIAGKALTELPKETNVEDSGYESLTSPTSPKSRRHFSL
ncbi:netrin receptor UNC5C-like [Ptychodera flava]|uniref:netrin receptor UNC5C-like n=1 Tax=Ptychodera flava TaxID=63121 RepID=UPI00396A6882